MRRALLPLRTGCLLNLRSSSVGLPWCRQESYEAFLAILEDADNFPERWELYVDCLEKAEKSLQDDGQLVLRIDINPWFFAAWCKDHGLAATSRSSFRFAAELVAIEAKSLGS